MFGLTFAIILISQFAVAQNTRLQVNITPGPAASAGAQWRMDGGDWQPAGAALANPTTHRALITFADIPGWNTPDPIKIWTFSGLDRETTATYTRQIRYPLGQIPPLQAYAGKALRFEVAAPDLGSSATLRAAVVAPGPVGPMTTDLGTSVGQFAYTADPADKTPFNVTFMAGLDGQTTQTQTVTISPIPTLPSEQTAFGVKSSAAWSGDADDSKPLVVDELVAGSGIFNLQPRPQLRKVTITGDEVIFDPADTSADSLYARFNYDEGTSRNADIQEMEINAATVIIRGPLRLPKTNVTINALELKFEDTYDSTHLPTVVGSIITTPLNYKTRAADAVAGVWDDQNNKYTTPFTPATRGADGERGGDMHFNVANAVVGNALRLDQQGARGQNGGNGLNGPDGRNLQYTSKYYDYVMPANEYITNVSCTEWAPPLPFPVDTTTFMPSQADIWPGYAGDAIPGAEPGNGGTGGDLYVGNLHVGNDWDFTQLNLASAGTQRGGQKGTVDTPICYGGMHGFPVISHRLWLIDVYGHVTQCTSDVKRTLTGTSDWYAVQQPWWGAVERGDYAAYGTLYQTSAPMSFLKPGWIQRGLTQAKTDFLNGDRDKAEERLSQYAEMVDVAEAKWAATATYSTEQRELLSLRDEMRGILNRIHANLDYFGNPAGWAPMLSFEVTADAFKQEIDHALNLMYLAYWVRDLNLTIAQRVSGMQQLRTGLQDDVTNLKAEFATLMERIPAIRTRAEQITNETYAQNVLMTNLTTRLRNEAIANLKITDAIRQGALCGTQMGLRLGGLIFQSIPVAQPALGAVGGVLDMAGKVDYNGIWDSAQGAITGDADVKTTYSNPLFGDNLFNLSKAVSEVKEVGEGEDDETNLSKATTAVCQGVTGVTGLLGEFKIPMPDIEGEAAKLLAQSDEYTTITTQLLALAREKMTLAEEMSAAIHSMTTIPNQISRDLLAMDFLQAEITRNTAALAPKTVEYINEIEQRSRERLLKYHYYMAKAYEYRLLKPYPGVLNLDPMIQKIKKMADTTSCTLTSDQFNSIKSLYVEQLSSVAETIFDQYNSNPPELSAPINFNLTGDQIARLNAGQPVILNLVEMGLFPANEENIRLDNITIDDLQVHLQGAGATRWATMDLYATHSGVSNIMSKGEVYQFHHTNALTENPLAWGVRYDHLATQKLTPISPSAASDSLLRSLLTGAATTDMLLYSRPGAWADIVLTKNVNTENNVDIVLDSVRLKVNYDFTRRGAGQSGLKVLVSQEGFTPYFKLSQTDLNSRQDGRGTFYRSFSNTGAITVEAQKEYGAWKFQKWTDAYGNDISSTATMAATGLLKPGIGRQLAALTNPAITIDLSSHRAIRAKYVNLALVENPAPADGATKVPANVTLAWAAVPDATSYDLYLWRASDPPPATPTASGLTVSHYLPATPLADATPYLWKVIVHADQLSQEGLVWGFQTAPKRTMVQDFYLYEP